MQQHFENGCSKTKEDADQHMDQKMEKPTRSRSPLRRMAAAVETTSTKGLSSTTAAASDSQPMGAMAGKGKAYDETDETGDGDWSSGGGGGVSSSSHREITLMPWHRPEQRRDQGHYNQQINFNVLGQGNQGGRDSATNTHLVSFFSGLAGLLDRDRK